MLSTINGVTSATLTTASLGVGVHTITSTYAGDANDLSNVSTSLSLSVGQDATSTAFSTSIAPAGSGQSGTLAGVTLTSVVSVSSPRLRSSNRKHNIRGWNDDSQGTASLSTANGVTSATFTIAPLGIGAHFHLRGLRGRRHGLEQHILRSEPWRRSEREFYPCVTTDTCIDAHTPQPSRATAHKTNPLPYQYESGFKSVRKWNFSRYVKLSFPHSLRLQFRHSRRQPDPRI